jgi:2,3-bisphosphoglycerate-dependent phosphoglycerate mutase
MDLIVVRHGLPERAEHSHDPPLSATGRRQAEATAAFLVGERVDHIVASPLARARQTAEPLADRLGLSIETVDGLAEIDPFGGAYVPAEEMELYHHVTEAFLADKYSLFDRAGGFEAFRGRVLDAFDGVIGRNRGRAVAVFCHGMVMGCYLTTVVGHDDPFVLNTDYCGISRIRAASNGLRTAVSANETGHLRDLTTGSPDSNEA